jgi:hypothetical protein
MKKYKENASSDFILQNKLKFTTLIFNSESLLL